MHGSKLKAFGFSILLLPGLLRADNRAIAFKQDPTAIKAFVGQALTIDLKSLITGATNQPLSWATFSDKPNWLTVDLAKQEMKGTPSAANIGIARFRLSVQQGDTGAFGRVDLTVTYAPSWTENPILLGTQKEDTYFETNLAPKVTNLLGGALTFSADSSLPSWLTLSSTGILSGTPRRANVGDYAGVKLTVTNSLGESAATEARGTVIKSVKPPRFRARVFNLPNAQEDFLYSQNISGAEFIEKLEPESVSFKMGQPTLPWLGVQSDGKLLGIPGADNLGTNSLFVTLSSTIDGVVYQDTAEFRFTVLHTNHAPVWRASPVKLPTGSTNKFYVADLSPFVYDPDGDAVTFRLVTGPKWVTVSPQGALAGQPTPAYFGQNLWSIEASDGSLASRSLVSAVLENGKPIWLVANLTLNAKEDFDFGYDLAPYATDPDGDPLSFSMSAGPAWMKVAANGKITGRPGAKDVGATAVRFRAFDGAAGATEVSGTVFVEHTNHAPHWTVSPIPLPIAKEDEAFQFDLASLATDIDGDALSFTKLSGPAWLVISENGRVTGTPKFNDVGSFTFEVAVSDGPFAVPNFGSGSVLPGNHAPIWKVDPVILAEADERSPYTADLAGWVQDTDAGEQLQFEKLAGPSWLAISRTGSVSGTPGRADVGLNEFQVKVVDHAGLFAEAKVRVTVRRVNRPPVVVSAIHYVLKERTTGTWNLNDPSVVSDPDGDALQFETIVVPSFVSLSGTGELQAKPLFTDIGTNQLQFKVSDGESSIVTLATIDVVRDPRPPVWSETPAYTATARETFSADVSSAAKDLDGIALHFKKVAGPNWITVSESGKVEGTPSDLDVGVKELTIEARNDLLPATVKISLTVLPKNHAPQWTEIPLPLTEAEAQSPWEMDLFAKVTDFEDDVLTFRKVSGPSWLNVRSDGRAFGTPLVSDVGEYVAEFAVTDGKEEVSVSAFGRVRPAPEVLPPVWAENPIRLMGRLGKPWAFALASKVTDPAGLPLRFEGLSLPSWMTLNTSGELSGTPSAIGLQNFSVIASNGDQEASVVVELTIEGGVAQVDTVQIDAPVPAAEVENIWVIEGAWPNNGNALLTALYQKWPTYRATLNSLGIYHTGVFLSGEAGRWKGTPITDLKGETLFRGDDAAWTQSVRERINRTLTRQPKNSPIWAVDRFFLQLPSLFFFENGFAEKGIPWEMMIVSQSRDRYLEYSKGTEQSKWTVTDFGNAFQEQAKLSEKSLRISAVSPKCPTRQLSDYATNDYRKLTEMTGGKFYEQNCSLNLDKVLREYAAEVAFRAKIHAKRRIPLTAVPLDASAIRLTLKDMPLSSKQWSYDSSRNEIVVYWYLIDLSAAKPGDSLKIEYSI